MIEPGRLDLVAQRWTPYVEAIVFEGIDLTGATFAMQVRLYRDAQGAPLIDLANAASSAEGVSVSVAVVEDVTVSTVQIRINETTLESLLLGSAGAGNDIGLVWDIHITGGGLGKTRWLEGSFTIRAGATQ